MTDPKDKNDKLIKDSNIDLELVKSIQTVQDLPEEIIIKFLNAKGSLHTWNIKNNYPEND